MIKKAIAKIIEKAKENPIKTAIMVLVPFGIPLVTTYLIYDKYIHEHEKISKKVDGSEEC